MRSISHFNRDNMKKEQATKDSKMHRPRSKLGGNLFLSSRLFLSVVFGRFTVGGGGGGLGLYSLPPSFVFLVSCR